MSFKSAEDLFYRLEEDFFLRTSILRRQIRFNFSTILELFSSPIVDESCVLEIYLHHVLPSLWHLVWIGKVKLYFHVLSLEGWNVPGKLLIRRLSFFNACFIRVFNRRQISNFNHLANLQHFFKADLVFLCENPSKVSARVHTLDLFALWLHHSVWKLEGHYSSFRDFQDAH